MNQTNDGTKIYIPKQSKKVFSKNILKAKTIVYEIKKKNIE